MIGKNTIQFTKQLHSEISHCLFIGDYSKEDLKIKIKNLKEISDDYKKKNYINMSVIMKNTLFTLDYILII